MAINNKEIIPGTIQGKEAGNEKEMPRVIHLCPHCLTWFNTRKLLAEHMNGICSRKANSRCEFCQFVTNDRMIMIKHLNEKHNFRPTKIQIKKFDLKKNFTVRQPLLRCTICNRPFYYKEKLEKHMKSICHGQNFKIL